MTKNQKEIFAALLKKIEIVAAPAKDSKKTSQQMFFDGLFYRPRVHKTHR